MLRKLALASAACLITVAAFAQPLTTKPSLTDMLTANCSAAHMITGGSVSPGCGTPGQIPGTATNDNASAGNVGEIITANKASGSAVSISPSGTTVNVTS